MRREQAYKPKTKTKKLFRFEFYWGASAFAPVLFTCLSHFFSTQWSRKDIPLDACYLLVLSGF